MLTVVSYDISENSIRNRVARHLERKAVRVQYSVFEVWMTDEQTRRLAGELAQMIERTDSLRFYAIGADGLRRSISYGPLPFLGKPGTIVV